MIPTYPENIAGPIAQDLQRDAYCLLGLPVDNLTMESTKALLHDKIKQKGNVVLSTVNVNWVVQSFTNPEFCDAILNSDIVILDGKPLLWLTKLLGYPMYEIVPGSTLIEELHQSNKSRKPLTIFLFGGEKGVARKAMERINVDKGGLHAVGALNPGFGTVEQMSSDDIINTINEAHPHILLVALGAKKGTQWIEYNRNRLNAKIISHLGATINFLAGTIQRAPKPFRKLGIEWIWRIFQEPKLFTRYAEDGLIMTRILLLRIFLWLQFLFWQKRFKHGDRCTSVYKQENDKEIVISFSRNAKITANSQMRAIFSKCVGSGKDITLDFQKAEFVDGAFIGLLIVFLKHLKRNGNNLFLINVYGRLSRIFRLMGAKKASWFDGIYMNRQT